MPHMVVIWDAPLKHKCLDYLVPSQVMVHDRVKWEQDVNTRVVSTRAPLVVFMPNVEVCVEGSDC